MARLVKRGVRFVEPINIFEQLEERIVLDAAITPPPNVQAVQPNTPVTVDVHAADESHAAFVYDRAPHAEDPNHVDGVQQGLEVKAPGATAFVAWQEFNASHTANPIQFNYDHTNPGQEGVIKWTPGSNDSGVYTFRVNSFDSSATGGPGDLRTDSAAFTVTVNTAPTLTGDGTYSLTATDEDHTSAAVSVSTIVGSTITDPDPGALQGVAIDGVTHSGPGSGSGTWEYSIDAGNSWNPFPSVSSTNALLLRGDDMVRYVGDGHDGETASFTYHAWDQTGTTYGKQGQAADISTTGDATPYSTGTDSASITVASRIDFVGSVTSGNDTAHEDTQYLLDVNTDYEQSVASSMKYSLVEIDLSHHIPNGLTIDETTGVISWNPTNKDVTDAATTYDFVVHAEHKATGETGDITFHLAVENKLPMFLNGEHNIYMTESSGVQTFNFQTDDEGDPTTLNGYSLLSYHGGAVPAWLQIDPGTGLLSGTPTNADVTASGSPHEVVVQFSDGHGGTIISGVGSQPHFYLSVQNLANEFTSPASTTWLEDAGTSNPTINAQTHDETTGQTVHYAFDAAGTVTQHYFNAAGFGPDYGPGVEILADGTIIPIFKASPTATVVENAAVTNQWVSGGSNPATWDFTIYAIAPLGPSGSVGNDVAHQDYTLTVVNNPPLITTEERVIVTQGPAQDAYITVDGISVNPSDPVAPPEPGATYTIQYAPTINGQLVTIDANTGVLHVPGTTNADIGTYGPFLIFVDDHHGGQASKMLLVQVANSSPTTFVLTPGDSATVQEDTNLSTMGLFLTTTDTGSGPAHYTLGSGAPSWLTINSSTGQLLGTPDDSEFSGPSSVSYAFDIIFNDGWAGSSNLTHRMSLTVTNTDPTMPTYTAGIRNDLGTWTEDAGFQSINVLGWDGSLAGGPHEGATFKFVANTGSYYDGNAHLLGGWLHLDADGRLWGIPENKQAGTWTFTIEVTDRYGATVTRDFTLAVANDIATWQTNGEIYFYRNGSTAETYDVSTDDEWSDNNGASPTLKANQYVLTLQQPAGDTTPDTANYEIPSGSWIAGIGSKNGVISYDVTHAPASNVSQVFTVWFNDGTEWVRQDVTIHSTNQVPGTVTPDTGFQSADHTTWIEDVGGQQFDVQYSTEGLAHHHVTYSLTGVSSDLAGLIDINSSGLLTWTNANGPENKYVTQWPTNLPPNETPGSITDSPHAFTIHVVDRDDGGNIIAEDDQPFSLSIQNVAPWWTEASSSAITITEDQYYSLAETVFQNSDEGSGAEAKYFLENGTTDSVPGWLKIHETTGEIYIDGPLDNGVAQDTWNIRVLFFDGHGAMLPKNLAVTLANDDSFALGQTTAITVLEDTPLMGKLFDVNHSDEGQPLFAGYQLDVSSLPAWLHASDIDFNTTTGEMTFLNNPVPNNSYVGSNTFRVAADDGHGGLVYQTLTINVTNRPSDFTEVMPTYGSADGRPDLNIVNSDTPLTVVFNEDASPATHNRVNFQADDEGFPSRSGQNPYYYLDSDAPKWLTLDPRTGELYGSPTNAHVNETGFTFKIHHVDQNGADSYQMILLKVMNREPQFANSAAVDWATDLPTWTIPAPTSGHGAVEDNAFSFDVSTDDELVGKNADGSYSTSYSLLNWDAAGFGSGNDPSTHDPAAVKTVPDWLSFNTTTGVMSGNPKNNDVADYYFAVRVDDGHGGVVIKPFHLHVDNVNPLFLTPSATSGEGGGNPHDVAHPYVMTVTEDAQIATYDLLANDDTQHNTHNNSFVYYYLDPATTPLGVRFATDTSTLGFVQTYNDPFPSDPNNGAYITSTTGVLVFDPTNCDVASGGIVFPIKVFDGNGGSDTIYVKLVVTNKDPQFTTKNALVWVEDHSSTDIDINTDDEPYDRFQGTKVSYSIAPLNSSDVGWDSAYGGTSLDTSIFGIVSTTAESVSLGKSLGQIYIKDARYMDANGNPDNELVGRYQFAVTFNDGTTTITQPFKLAIDNDPTKITNINANAVDHAVNPPTSTTLTYTQGDTITIDATARDEYDPATHIRGHYTLQVDWNNDGSIDDTNVVTGDRRASNGAPITFDPETGQISWTPNNVDVPDAGHTQHRFIITHFDDNNTQDSTQLLLQIANKAPEWTDTTGTPTPGIVLPPWILTEDTGTIGTYVSYGNDTVRTTEEGQDLTYTLKIDHYDYANSHWTSIGNSTDSVIKFVNSTDSTYTAAAGWKQGYIHTEGGRLLFNVNTGAILWRPNNADVTRAEDSDPSVAGIAIPGRYDYTFSVQGDDGNGGLTTAKSFLVTVDNVTTKLTGSDQSGNGHNEANPVIDITISEDRDDNSGNSALVDVAASPTYGGDEDQDLGSNPNAEAAMDAHYSLKLWDNGTGTWVTIFPSGTAANPGGGLISFNKDTGQISWRPNDLDIGNTPSRDYFFEVTHYDGNGTWDSDQFTVTVNNTAPKITSVAEWLLVEDDSVNHASESSRWTLNMDSDDEHLGGVTYSLSIGGTDVTAAASGAGYYPNGEEHGGKLTFTTTTGVITWETTNADVNWTGTNYVDAGQKYFFTVTATDKHGNPGSLTSTQTFEAKVQEVKPEIDAVVYTDVSDPSQTITTPVAPTASDPAAVIHWNEDQSQLVIDFHSNDEQQESNTSFIRDSYYVLTVSGPDGAGGTVAHAFTYLADHAVQTWHQTGLGLSDGGTMSFNPDTGIATWIPNDRDVGSWTFATTHYDGQTAFDQVTVQVNIENKVPDLTVPTVWVFQEYPVNAQDAASHPLQSQDWLLPQAQIWSDDEGERAGFTYSLSVTDSGGTAHAVNQIIPVGIDHNGDSDWVGAQINGINGGWLLLNVRNGEMEWKTTNADVTLGLNGDDLGRNPYTFVVQATDPSNGHSVEKFVTVNVLNRDTGIVVSSIDDSTHVTEHTAREFDINALDEQIERSGIDTTYHLQVHVDTNHDGALEWVDVADYNSTYRDGRGIVTFYAEPDAANGIPAGWFSWTPNNLDSIAGELEFRVYHDDANLSIRHHDFVLMVDNTTPQFTVDFPDTVILTEDAFENGLPSNQYTIFDGQIQTNEELQGVTYSLDVTNASGATVHVNNSIPVGLDHTGDPDWVGAQINVGGGWVLFNVNTGQTEWKTTNADVTIDSNASPDPLNAYSFSVTANDHTTNGPEAPTVAQSYKVQVRNDPTDINNIPDQQFEQGQLWQLMDNDVHARDELVGPNTWYSLTVSRGLPGGGSGAALEVADFNAEVALTGGAPITFDSHTGAISWPDTTNRDVGLYHFVVTHHDGHNTIASDPFDVSLVNKVPRWTSTPPDGLVVMATKPFSYDANTTEEGLNDWRGDDVAEYSIVQGPPGMTIDHQTGVLSWTADPKLAGHVPITIKMDDGNGGVIFQTFTIIVDDPHNNLPENGRNHVSPFTSGAQPEEPSNPEAMPPVFESAPEGIWGSWQHPAFPTAESAPESGSHLLEEIVTGKFKSFEELMTALDEYGLKQPTLDKPGSISPITELAGYADDVAHGKRLDFNATGIWQWQGLTQPVLDVASSQGPDTPLEGYMDATEAGKRLNFGYYPIRQAHSLTLEEMRVADLLGL
jgi:hypothetical protein